MTIRTRLAVIYGAAMVVTIVTAGWLLWFQLGVTLRGALDQAIELRATAALANLENQGQAGLQEGDAPAAPAIFVAIFDTSGQRIDASAATPASLTRPAAGLTNGDIVIGTFTYAIHVVVADGGITVVAGSDLATLSLTLDRLARALALVGGVAASVSLVGGWWLAGRAMRPVARLTEEAASINAADLDRRLPVPAQTDELRALATTLNAMLDRVSEAVRRQRIFVASASHDLRTPLAALQAELELADDDRTTNGEVRHALRAAHADVVRLGGLATALLGLATVEGDGRAVVRTPVRVDQLVASVARCVEPSARERGTRILEKAPDRVVTVDRIRIEQALTNLVLNAITHGAAGSVVEIVAHVEPTIDAGTGLDTILTIDVLDRGPGVPAAIVDRLFEPFLRGPGASGPGAGLGLATAAAAIQAHRGTLGVQARDGGGSRFWFRVPA